MLVIREEQIGIFYQYMRDNFVKRMVIHLHDVFPEETSELDENALSTIIENGLSKAEKYEIFREIDVERYLDLMFFLSFDFDVNSQTSWASHILQKDWDGETKIEVLYAKYEALKRSNTHA